MLMGSLRLRIKCAPYASSPSAVEGKESIHVTLWLADRAERKGRPWKWIGPLIDFLERPLGATTSTNLRFALFFPPVRAPFFLSKGKHQLLSPVPHHLPCHRLSFFFYTVLGRHLCGETKWAYTLAGLLFLSVGIVIQTPPKKITWTKNGRDLCGVLLLFLLMPKKYKKR